VFDIQPSTQKETLLGRQVRNAVGFRGEHPGLWCSPQIIVEMGKKSPGEMKSRRIFLRQ
jgi:hypothetical protein